MKTTTYIVLTLAAAVTAQADFSYSTTQKAPTGMMGGVSAGAPTVTRHMFKGQKLKTDSGDNVMIMDFDAQTITSVNHSKKVYSVMKFSDLGANLKTADVETKIDVKETGQKKLIGDVEASEVVMTMEVESPQSAGMKMQMEVDMWLSQDVPGAKELKAFYQKNMGSFPWAAMSGGSGGMQKAIADMQKKMANIGGVPVLQITRMKAGGAGPQMAQAQAGMAQARAQLEAMVAKGGPGAEMAKQQLARMGAMGAGGGAPIMEITQESSGFSAKAIADSEFAIPAGYTKQDSPLGRVGGPPPPPRPR